MGRNATPDETALRCAASFAVVAMVVGCSLFRPGRGGEPDRDALFRDFRARYGSGWHVEWQEGAALPGDLSGGAIEVEPALTEANVEAVVRKFLSDNRPFLRVDDGSLRLSWSDYDAPLTGRSQPGTWRVVFEQLHRGVPVLGAQVRVTLRNQRIVHVTSSYRPSLTVRTTPALDQAQAARAALEHLGCGDTIRPIENRLMVAAGPLDTGQLVYRVVMPVVRDPTFATTDYDTMTVAYCEPWKQWVCYVDAGNGDVLLQTDAMAYARIFGTVTGPVRPTSPTDASEVRPMRGMQVAISPYGNPAGMTLVVTNDEGYFECDVDATRVKVSAEMSGPRVRVTKGLSTAIEHSGSIVDVPQGGLDAGWNWEADDPTDGYGATNVFHHLDSAYRWFNRADPDDVFDFEPTLPVRRGVDIYGANPRHYNTYRDHTWGSAFGRPQSEEYRSAALAPDVIYHEYYHAWAGDRDQEFGDLFHSVNEAFADYFAAAMTDDPVIGEGVALPRNIDIGLIDGQLPSNGHQERRYPCVWPLAKLREPRYWATETYTISLVLSGALWDMRNAFAAMPGGLDYADRLAASAAKDRPSDFSDCLVSVLEADDEGEGSDGLENGTPNIDLICHAFGDLHGIYCDWSEGHTHGPVAGIELLGKTIAGSWGMSIIHPYVLARPFIEIRGTLRHSARRAADGSPLPLRFQLAHCYEDGPDAGGWSADGMVLTNGGNLGTGDLPPGSTLGYWTPPWGRDGWCRVRLTASEVGGEVIESCNPAMVIRMLHPNWPGGQPPPEGLSSRDWTLSSPAVGQVIDEGDEQLEVVEVSDPSTNGCAVTVRRHDGTRIGWALVGASASIHRPALAELDAEPGCEIVCSDADGTVTALRSDGSSVTGWPQNVGGCASNPAVADLDGDERPEVVVVSFDDTPNHHVAKLHAFDREGSVFEPAGTSPDWPAVIPEYDIAGTKNLYPTAPAIGQVDGSGGLDVVVQDGEGRVTVWKHDATLAGIWIPPGESPYARTEPALVDLNGDDLLDRQDVVVLVAPDEDADEVSVYALTMGPGGLSVLEGWPVRVSTGGEFWSAPSIAHLGSDDTPEVLALIGDSVFAWRANGERLAGWPVSVGPSSVWPDDIYRRGRPLPAPIVADVDEDLDPEVIAGLSRLFAFDADGTPLTGWPRIRPETDWVTGTPTVADIDDDGELELVATRSGGGYYRFDGLLVWDLGVSAYGVMPWPTDGGNAGRTRSYGPGLVMDIEVLDPNGGEWWPVDAEMAVIWRCVVGPRPEHYDIYYRTREDNNVPWLPVADEFGTEARGVEYDPNELHQQFIWRVPPPTTDQARVKVIAYRDVGAAKDSSDAVFHIVEEEPSLRVTLPDANTRAVVGLSQDVQWRLDNVTNPRTVTIWYKVDGVDDEFISCLPPCSYGDVAGEDEDPPTWEWPSVPNRPTEHALIKVRVYYGDQGLYVEDVSDHFLIVAQAPPAQPDPPAVTVLFPVGDYQWLVGTQQPIVWSHSGGPVETDHVEYSIDGGTTWRDVPSGANMTATTVLLWTPVAADVTDHAFVRVTAEGPGGTGTGMSGEFWIVTGYEPPAVKVNGPSNARLWVGEPTPVTWWIDGPADSDHVYVNYDPLADPATWVLVDRHSPPVSECSWTPPDLGTPEYWISVKVKAWNSGLEAEDVADTASTVYELRPCVYVSSRGDDAWDGSQPEQTPSSTQGPKRTIQAGIEATPDGGLCLVGSGIFQGNLLINRPICLRGEGADKTRIAGDAGVVVRVQNTDDVVIDGFEIRAGEPSTGIRCDQVGNCEIRHNVLLGHEDGIVFHADGSAFRSLVADNTLLYNHVGITITGQRITLWNTIVRAATGAIGLRVGQDAALTCDYNLIYGYGSNVIEESGGSALPGGHDITGLEPQLTAEYVPESNSPCRNAGFDFCFETSAMSPSPYFGPAPDIGAFEFEE